MSDDRQLLRDFLVALVDPGADLHPFLHGDSWMRFWGWAETITARSCAQVIDILRGETAGWSEPRLEIFELMDAGRLTATFRVTTRVDSGYWDHNRAVFATVRDGLLDVLEIYASLPQRSARRKGYRAPATLARAEVSALLDEVRYNWDSREDLGPNSMYHQMPTLGWGGSGIAHPGGNFVGFARWSADEADEQIEAVIQRYASRSIGFHWWINTNDTPPDLAERVERRGLVRAGEVARMARVGLDDLSDIPTNQTITVEVLDGSRLEPIEETLEIAAESFHWTPDLTESEREGWYEEVLNPARREKTVMALARLNGEAVACGRLGLRGPVCLLAGAATRPAARGQHIYSTLLKGRLEAARDRGYHIAVIDAEPMSRRVVAKYGFQVFSLTQIYGWMPEMDAAVIKALVPDD